MGFRMKDFNIFGFHRKICAFFFFEGRGKRRRVRKKQYIGRIAPKRGLGQFADIRRAWQFYYFTLVKIIQLNCI